MSERGTGGNRFIDADSDRGALVAAIERGLAELEAWVADDPNRTPIPAKGRLGLWTPDPELVDAVLQQLAEEASR